MLPVRCRVVAKSPHVFATCTSSGKVCIFDVSGSTGMNKPVVAIPAGGDSGEAVFSLAFNPKTRGIVATGGADGMVRIHKLGWSLSNELPRDAVVIGDIARIGLDVEDGSGKGNGEDAAAAEEKGE